MNNDKNTQDWKLKLNDLVQTCQSELKKTTKIGMKMLSASQSNAQLHETYEELGHWLKNSIESGDLKIEDAKVIELIAKVRQLESELEGYEEEVQNIKKNP
jgi:anti-sigma28 factor (negative regulator of flagellin synthesis)